jgi:hypothetical protein
MQGLTDKDEIVRQPSGRLGKIRPEHGRFVQVSLVVLHAYARIPGK